MIGSPPCAVTAARTHLPVSLACARVALLALVALLGCARGPLLEQAIAARGGPLRSLTREVEARVYYGIPGLWRFEMAFKSPDRYRLTVITEGEPQHYLFDGDTARAFVGSRLVSEDDAAGTALRTHARWLSVISLDALARDDVTWTERPARGDVPRAFRALEGRFADSARYRLSFDESARLVGAEGPIEIPGIGSGRLSARFRDFRRVAGFELPFATRYSLNGEPFFDERVIRLVPADPALAAASFREPPGS